jgi:hypothetical protein
MNLSRFVRRNYSSEQLSDYIVGNIGRRSATIFESILPPRRGQVFKYISATIEDDLAAKNPEECQIWNDIKAKGPSLVSQFRLDRWFLTYTQSNPYQPVIPHFEGRVQPDLFGGGKPKHHAMVLVGMKQNETGSWTLVLQN